MEPSISNILERSAAAMASHTGVSITPGEIVFTRIGASSDASALPSPSTALLSAAGSVAPLGGLWLEMPENRIIEPPGRMLGEPYLAAKYWPQNLLSKPARATEVSCSASGAMVATEPGVTK